MKWGTQVLSVAGAQKAVGGGGVQCIWLRRVQRLSNVTVVFLEM